MAGTAANRRAGEWGGARWIAAGRSGTADNRVPCLSVIKVRVTRHRPGAVVAEAGALLTAPIAEAGDGPCIRGSSRTLQQSRALCRQVRP